VVYVTQVCRQLSKNLYDIYHCWVDSDGQRSCPKHLEFHFQNKFYKLVNLVGFVVRKCHSVLSYWNTRSICRWTRTNHNYVNSEHFCLFLWFYSNLRHWNINTVPGGTNKSWPFIYLFSAFCTYFLTVSKCLYNVWLLSLLKFNYDSSHWKMQSPLLVNINCHFIFGIQMDLFMEWYSTLVL
jgi:hypothetical protein